MSIVIRLYLNNASMKQRESLNLLKTAHRLEATTTQIKSNANNIKVLQTQFVLKL
jgi:hypothetical protein